LRILPTFGHFWGVLGGSDPPLGGGGTPPFLGGVPPRGGRPPLFGGYPPPGGGGGPPQKSLFGGGTPPFYGNLPKNTKNTQKSRSDTPVFTPPFGRHLINLLKPAIFIKLSTTKSFKKRNYIYVRFPLEIINIQEEGLALFSSISVFLDVDPRKPKKVKK